MIAVVAVIVVAFVGFVGFMQWVDADSVIGDDGVAAGYRAKTARWKHRLRARDRTRSTYGATAT